MYRYRSENFMCQCITLDPRVGVYSTPETLTSNAQD